MFIAHEKIDSTIFINDSNMIGCGAGTSFFGTVRDNNYGKEVRGIFYECYEKVANKKIGRIIEGIKDQTGVALIKVLHRVGWLPVGEIALAVFVGAPHRKEAFAACQAVIDEIKAEVPIWKKEVYADGTEVWDPATHQKQPACEQ